jgi:predicted acylesterase/phospholipase RssA
MCTMPAARAGAVLCMLLSALAACSRTNAYSNKPLPTGERVAEPAEPSSGQLQPIWAGNPRCFQRAKPWGPDILALTLSGGGSRAAVFGAAVMLELQDIGALDAVDLVSSVSGGSLAAALYALSRDPQGIETNAGPGETGRIVWTRDNVLGLASQNLLKSWIWRWLRPDSIAKYWLTAYDRTDLFADTLDGGLFAGLGNYGGYPTFTDLNPQRATLILNATNFTDGRNLDLFTFTPWDFDGILGSDICTYGIADAVAASAAFPGFLHYSTLRDFNHSGDLSDHAASPSYVHLMDGGATDNLGLKGLDQAMERLKLCDESPGRPQAALVCRKRLVLIVDAQNGFQGRDPSTPDPRKPLDRLVDMNFLDAYDTLMHAGYGQLLRSFRRDIEEHGSGQADGAGVLHLPLMTFIRDDWLGYDGQYGNSVSCSEVHFAIERACALETRARRWVANEDKAELRDMLRRIDTDWRIEPDQVACLEVAAYALVDGARPELEKFFGHDKVLRPQNAARFARVMRKCLGQPDTTP